MPFLIEFLIEYYGIFGSIIPLLKPFYGHTFGTCLDLVLLY